jgi:uncharacterized protein YndB with AHSA1/START domain
MNVRPDLTSRPYQLIVERAMLASPDVVYRAWTEQFDQWFAEPGTLLMTGEVDVPFFFETHFEGGRHPHYGRFLKLVPNQLIEMTWVTGNPHAGFTDEKVRDGHEEAWPLALANLDDRMVRA